MADGLSQVSSSRIDGLLASFLDILSPFVVRQKEHSSLQNTSIQRYKAGFSSTAVILSFDLIQIAEYLAD
jgi:hypothetical protein